MEKACFSAILWILEGAAVLYGIYRVIMFFIEQRDERLFQYRLIRESLYRIEDLLSTSSIGGTDQLRAHFKEGKEISKRISEEYEKLLKEWEAMAASCKHPASHDTDQNHQ